LEDIVVLVNESDIRQWKVHLKGPDASLYAGRWWYLYVIFPNEYPGSAPVMRVITFSYLMNVSADGYACLDLLAQRYDPARQFSELLVGVRELLDRPRPILAVQIEKLWNFQRAKEEYEASARTSLTNDLSNVNFLDGLQVKDDPWFVLDLGSALARPDPGRDFNAEAEILPPAQIRLQDGGQAIIE
jgi:ubiquitin-protein ligase